MGSTRMTFSLNHGENEMGSEHSTAAFSVNGAAMMHRYSLLPSPISHAMLLAPFFPLAIRQKAFLFLLPFVSTAREEENNNGYREARTMISIGALNEEENRGFKIKVGDLLEKGMF